MTNEVGLTFSVGDIVLQGKKNTIEQDKVELVTLNIMFSVVLLKWMVNEHVFMNLVSLCNNFDPPSF